MYYGWLVFNGISILVGYLMANLVIYIWLESEKFVGNFIFQQSCQTSFLHTVKWFQILLFNTNNSI